MCVLASNPLDDSGLWRRILTPTSPQCPIPTSVKLIFLSWGSCTACWGGAHVTHVCLRRGGPLTARDKIRTTTSSNVKKKVRKKARKQREGWHKDEVEGGRKLRGCWRARCRAGSIPRQDLSRPGGAADATVPSKREWLAGLILTLQRTVKSYCMLH